MVLGPKWMEPLISWIVLGSKLTFHDHHDVLFTKLRRAIGLLCKLNSILIRAALMTIFKT